MSETQLTGRGIMIVILCVVILISGGMLALFIYSPGHDSPAVTRQTILTAAIITGLATAWLVWLIVRSIQDRRRGIDRAPAKVSGWFHVIFGAAVAAAGAACSLLSYRNHVDMGQGFWTFYWGMIVWGLLQMAVGGMKIRSA